MIRHSIRNSCVLLLLLCFAVNTAAAQDKKSPPPELKKLYGFVGEWQGKFTFTEGETNMTFDMTMTGETVVGGAAIHLAVYANTAEFGDYFEEDFVAWDAQLKEVTMFAVSNFGEVGKYSGHWVSGENTLKLGETRIVGDVEIKADLTISFVDKDTISWDVEMLRGDKPGSFRGKFTRK